MIRKNPTDDGDINATLDFIVNGLSHPQPTGLKTYPILNNIFGGGLQSGNLITIGARTSVGKTTFCINIAHQIAERNNDVEIDYFSLEMNKKEIVNKFISLLTGINSLKLKALYHLSENQKDQVKQAVYQLHQSNLRIFDKANTLKQILSIIRTRVRHHSKDHYVAVIDYIGLIKVENTYKDRYLQIGQITGSFKRLANDYSIPIIIIT